MQKDENLVSKTVRLDMKLIEQVMDVLDQEENTWRTLNFSDGVRYGLVLVLAAHGVEYDKSHFPRYDRVDSSRRMKSNATLEQAIKDLIARFEDDDLDKLTTQQKPTEEAMNDLLPPESKEIFGTGVMDAKQSDD